MHSSVSATKRKGASETEKWFGKEVATIEKPLSSSFGARTARLPCCFPTPPVSMFDSRFSVYPLTFFWVQ